MNSATTVVIARVVAPRTTESWRAQTTSKQSPLAPNIANSVTSSSARSGAPLSVVCAAVVGLFPALVGRGD
jgi:hypothetical protein